MAKKQKLDDLARPGLVAIGIALIGISLCPAAISIENNANVMRGL